MLDFDEYVSKEINSVKSYLDENKIKRVEVAKLTGYSRQDVTNVLNGSNSTMTSRYKLAFINKVKQFYPIK